MSIAEDRGGPAAERYARQLALGVIGPAGQQRLAASSLLLIGCGALGSTQAELAARAGVGRLILVDRDLLELHNLQRQLLFDEDDVRQRLPKATAAARHLRQINSSIEIEAVVTDLSRTNVLELLGRADLILDGTDNIETRYLLNDAALQQGKPWIYGGVLGTEGMVMPISPGSGPCLRCVFPEPAAGLGLPTCETQGVLGTAVTWVAALQVTLALRILVGAPPRPTQLLTMDIWSGVFRSLEVARASGCPCCDQRRFDFLEGERGASTSVICGRNAVQITPASPVSVELEALAEKLRPLGQVVSNGLLLELQLEERRLIVFPDGRLLVTGTSDPAEARSLVARYLGS